MADESPAPCTIWRFFDGKAGHRNQILGLTDAISRMTQAEYFDVDASGSLRGIRSLLPGRLRSLEHLPAPTLMIGAGHATHLPMLAARRRFGGRIVVLMKPSLPLFLFDLCLIPEADGLKRIPSNTILTEGALNRIRPSDSLDAGSGLILIGGPSRHFGWSDQAVLSQVKAVTERHPEIQWTLTTSRRTPASFLGAWHSSGRRGQMVPFDQTGPDWLPEKLKSADIVWVTNESVSMIYEALTSGSRVGILTLPKSRESRVARGIDSLISRNLVTPFDRWQQTAQIKRAALTIDESSRCAELITQRFLPPVPSPHITARRVA